MNMFDYTLYLLKQRMHHPWPKTQSLDDWQHLVFDEAMEHVQAESPQHIAEEAGDVLANVVMLILRLEDKTAGEINLNTVLKGIETKLKSRKPWMFGEGPMPTTAEEEVEIWNAQKAKEKKS